MKATGMVRRMDELGRVVIPKEIRRTMHLHEGEELEIYAKDEGLYMKKYSALSALEGCADEYMSISRFVKGDLAVVDLDHVLAGVGAGCDIAQKMASKIQSRANAIWQEPTAICLAGNKYPYGMVCPILVRGDLYGALILGATSPIDERQQIVMLTASALLAGRLGE